MTRTPQLAVCFAAALVAVGCTQAEAPAHAPAAAVVPAAVAPFPAGDLVDLSHAYDDKTIFWPTAAEGFRLQRDADGVTAAGFYYAANSFSTAEHGGTHLDAPVHFAQGRSTAEQIPIERFIGPAFVVDVTSQSEADADYQVSVEDLQRAERAQGTIPKNSILLLRTGFSKRWPDAARYLGTAERGQPAVAKLHFPGLHPDAARWLVGSRAIAAIGIDTASIDYGQSTMFESHRVLFAADVPAFENLAALERLPARGAHIVALPMKIARGTGAPLRAIAILPPR